jgi:selenocysteine lyase/cysteine desulfurase
MIPCQRHLFELPDDVAYFNCAYTAPLMRTAAAAGHKALEQKNAPWTITANDFFETGEENRTLFSRLVEGNPDQVAITPAVSYGIALAAKNLPVEKNQTILVLQDQFPSNVYSWRRLADARSARIITIPRPVGNDWTAAVLDAIDESTAIAALPNCHWTDGTVLDLVRIGKKCRSNGTALVIDAIQSLGVMPFSVREVQPDFLAVGTHKWLLGAYSYGFCYVASKWLDSIPLEENWLNRDSSEDFSRLVDYRDSYQHGARRFDMGGGSNFFLAPIVKAALTQILKWGVKDIAATLRNITGQIAERAVDLGFQVAPDEVRVPHLLGLYLPRGLPRNLTALLAGEKVYASVRGDAIRIAPHIYNSPADLDRLFAALGKIVS